VTAYGRIWVTAEGFGVHRRYSSAVCAKTVWLWNVSQPAECSREYSYPVQVPQARPANSHRAISLSSFVRDISRSSNCRERRYSASSRDKSSRLVWIRRASIPASEFWLSRGKANPWKFTGQRGSCVPLVHTRGSVKPTPDRDEESFLSWQCSRGVYRLPLEHGASGSWSKSSA